MNTKNSSHAPELLTRRKTELLYALQQLQSAIADTHKDIANLEIQINTANQQLNAGWFQYGENLFFPVRNFYEIPSSKSTRGKRKPKE